MQVQSTAQCAGQGKTSGVISPHLVDQHGTLTPLQRPEQPSLPHTLPTGPGNLGGKEVLSLQLPRPIPQFQAGDRMSEPL